MHCHAPRSQRHAKPEAAVHPGSPSQNHQESDVRGDGQIAPHVDQVEPEPGAHGERHHPEEVGVALDAFARVEHEPMPLQKAVDIAEGNEYVVAHPCTTHGLAEPEEQR